MVPRQSSQILSNSLFHQVGEPTTESSRALTILGGNGAGAPPRGTQETAGALGMGLQASSGLVLLFQFLAYIIPIFGGWLADVKIGRYKAIVCGVLIAGLAHIVQIIGAIPSVLQKGKGNSAPPFVIGLLLLALGAGTFKPNIAPTIMDQYRREKQYTAVLKSGEKVIVDQETTNMRTMLIFYALTNVGAFYQIATTYSEKYVGYWLSFLEAGAIYFSLPILLILVYNRTYKTPPKGGSELTEAFKITWTALRRNNFRFWRKGFWDAVKPSVQQANGNTEGITWSEKTVEDVRRTISACEIFCYYPIWLLNDGGIGSVATNQGASMTTNGAPNDLLNNFNPLTIIVSVPILTYFIYPTLARFKLSPGRITRITIGFFFATIGGLCGTLVQWRVYKTSPCGYQASTCETGVSPISIWWQIPNNVFSAWSEIFCNVTAYEIAYARSPPHMKGLVTSIFLFMNALSAAIGEILIPATKDPWLIWIWAAPTIALAVQSVLFWFKFRHLNNDEYMISDKDFEGSDTEAGSIHSNNAAEQKTEQV